MTKVSCMNVGYASETDKILSLSQIFFHIDVGLVIFTRDSVGHRKMIVSSAKHNLLHLFC